jgi:hypothetical protein
MGLSALVAVMVALLARTRAGSFAAHVPTFAAMAVAWSGGASIAIGSSVRALRRDLDQGIVALARLRGVGSLPYVYGRVYGLSAVVAMTVAGSALLVGLGTLSTSADPVGTLREIAAGIAYGLAFGLTIGPLAVATLGTGSRVGGYWIFLLVLAVPELLGRWTQGFLPTGWHELTSIPAALAAVSDGVRHGEAALWHAARAIAGLTALVAASFVIVWAHVERAESGGAS